MQFFDPDKSEHQTFLIIDKGDACSNAHTDWHHPLGAKPTITNFVDIPVTLSCKKPSARGNIVSWWCTHPGWRKNPVLK